MVKDIESSLRSTVKTIRDNGGAYHAALVGFKRIFITDALLDAKGNQCQAARELGMHRNTLSRNITELRINMHEITRTVRAKRLGLL